MPAPANVILERMLERLYASLVQGPCLNCRPHSSRQRIDLTTLQSFKHLSPGEIIPKLLSGSHKVEVSAKVPVFDAALRDDQLGEAQRAAKDAFESQTRLLGKLRDIAEDARDYEQETGENALYIGCPILSIPPGAEALGTSTARVLAPLALIPIDMAVKRGATQSVSFSAKGSGVDLVVANFPLLAWLEQQTGRDTSELFTDEDGSQPWKEINEITKLLAEGLRLAVPPEFNPERALESIARFEQLPKGPTFLNAAVLGLFPVSNQGLLRDMKAMVNGESLSGPIENFLSARIVTTQPGQTPPVIPPAKRARRFDEERLVSGADPCQTRAVRLSKEASTLVIHGPPGTGKSQTITNIIGDHLGRGERVLFVCDKRTALDVVQNRLDHVGLGEFCAVVHDPQRDQRSLYMKVRDQLENLSERKTDPAVETRLQQTDDELQRLHLELTGYFAALSEAPAPGQLPFHDLVGEWFCIESKPGASIDEGSLTKATIADHDAASAAIQEVLQRARDVVYPHNPWAKAAGLQLADLLSRPLAEFRAKLSTLQGKAAAVDTTWSEEQPPLGAQDLPQQAANREAVAQILTTIDALGLRGKEKLWFDKGPELLRRTISELESLSPPLFLVASEPLDVELRSSVPDKLPSLAGLHQALDTLQKYDAIARKWYGFLAFGRKSAAQQTASVYGLILSPGTSERLGRFLKGLKARLVCQELYHRLFEPAAGGTLLGDSDLLSSLGKYRTLLTSLVELHAKTPELVPFIAEAFSGTIKPFVESLIASATRARALADFVEEMKQSAMFSATWLAEMDRSWRLGSSAGPPLSDLVAKLDSLETILRLRLAYERVPSVLHDAVDSLIQQSAESDTGLAVLKKALLAKEISARIRGSSFLQQVDQDRVERCYKRYRELEATKRTLVRDAIIHQWVARQKSRLLAATGTQLNSDGAALKRRLLTRGERAMKLRQMILAGAQGAQPDPLFDMCPVWMASPATVAQVFPRQAVFDVIVFDEASQCRLEESLPVLTRGRRIVIAGDPKQLPPTRFFEGALVESDTEQAETEQDLFEQQQGEIEDLLTAALNIEVEQCYLDVHYRSRHEALIGFSNRNFYQDRLQPIPAHPSRRGRTSPIRLIRADGIYERRGNVKEAQIVCELIAELLGRPHPPSIGVACFNLTQRDVILDVLEERCEREPQFAQRLEEARNRRGQGSFEGLFVKNLENVQGDERDHMIISTTFGPDPNGKFRRNFGPVGYAGGGRRLNVLVTRAREMIHLITSIPRTEYAALPELESGRTPGGRWLLYAYVHYADALGRLFAEKERQLSTAQAEVQPKVHLNSEASPSRLSRGLANHLVKDHALSSDVPWGNEGFCVDLAIRRPGGSDDITIGVLCDMTRFSHAADPVEWDLFRTEVLENQGWKLHRVWSTALYSDPERHKRAIAQAAKAKADAIAQKS